MWQGLLHLALILVILIAIVPRFGTYIARVFLKEKTILDPVMQPLEKAIFILSGVEPKKEMTPWQYSKSLLSSNLIMFALVYILIMLQGVLPFNPANLKAPSWDLVLHTAISFISNSDLQHYSGEVTLSHASQMFALGFLMFVSPATGLAVGIAFLRGLTGKPLGNFYVDLTQAITRILLPISFIGAVLLIFSGIPETLESPAIATTLAGATQYIARGPVAHFEIIKQLGENGGGFFGVNSAHPFENPNAISNFIETMCMLLIPASLIYTYGIMAENKKQAWLLFAAIFIIYAVSIGIAATGESYGNPLINNILDRQVPNLEGKEVRFGWMQTSLWAVTTTATMTGSANGMHDSSMPSSICVFLINMFVQALWGGQGTGIAYLLVYVILTVFIAGLMVGRTPEFLRRKIEKREIVLSSLILLIHPFLILIPGAIALSFARFQSPDLAALAGITNPGFHGISQVIYEYTSAAANNGSGLEGLADNNLWWNLSTALTIVGGRYIPIVALLLLAGGMNGKQLVPENPGTLRVDTILFTATAVGILLILGALTFLPVLALGAIGEAISIY